MTGGYARAGVELRFAPSAFDRWLTLRAGAGARAGVVLQTIAETGAAAASPATKSAFSFGPELMLGARLHFSRARAAATFADLALTGALPFLREEDALRAVFVATGSASIGVRF